MIGIRLIDMDRERKNPQLFHVKHSILESLALSRTLFHSSTIFYYFHILFRLETAENVLLLFWLIFCSFVHESTLALKLIMVFPSHRFTTHFRLWQAKELSNCTVSRELLVLHLPKMIAKRGTPQLSTLLLIYMQTQLPLLCLKITLSIDYEK